MLALGAVFATVTLAVVVAQPGDRAMAATTTLGSGACTSSVDGLTGLASSGVRQGTMCGVMITDGTGTWTVPEGVTEISLELLAGGGGGGNIGGGGAGGVVLLDGGFTLARYTDPARPTVSVTPGQTFAVSIGAGGIGGNHLEPPANGSDTSFGDYTARGGGAGGSWDPVTGIGTAGADGGSGGGGAPTATVADQANPGVVMGGDGGAADASPNAVGHAGGAGAGTRTDFGLTGSPPPYQIYLAGGGGGGAGAGFRCALGDGEFGNMGALKGPFVGETVGQSRMVPGEGGDGLLLGVAYDVAGEEWVLQHGTWAQGGGGGGAVTAAAVTSGQGGGAGCAYPNSGGTWRDGSLINRPPAQPRDNSGQGGGGGASTDGMVKGTNGSSGIVAIAWAPPGGGGAGAPGAPTNVTGAPGTGSADLSWTAPDTDGGSEITGYVVEWSSDGGLTWNQAPMCFGTAASCTVTGLVNGTGYLFRVAAVNANGSGPWSEPSGTVTPGAVAPRFTG